VFSLKDLFSIFDVVPVQTAERSSLQRNYLVSFCSAENVEKMEYSHESEYIYIKRCCALCPISLQCLSQMSHNTPFSLSSSPLI